MGLGTCLDKQKENIFKNYYSQSQDRAFCGQFNYLRFNALETV